MALNTPDHLRNLVIYELYLRNHTKDGTFLAAIPDLPRLKRLGVDVVWLMPIHPIGERNKKGSLGCPYSIQDYRAVNPEYGTMAEFEQLLSTAHDIGLKVWIDIVFNHTAHDAKLVTEHPEWYHVDDAGNPTTTVPAWSDIIDLKPNPELESYLVDTLKFWAEKGVDGFRCDVASVIPMRLWHRARQECAAINPDLVWLAESVHSGFVEDRRRQGLSAVSDSELYAAFDITYDYDIWSLWEAAVAGDMPLSHYLGALRWQDAIYPANYIKLRCVENHDQPRIMRRAPSYAQALAWTAFAAFNKGAFLIYGGQEAGNKHTPSLFDEDKIAWGTIELATFTAKLCHMKKEAEITNGQFSLLAAEPGILACWQTDEEGLLGLFNVQRVGGKCPLPLPDGAYVDILTGRKEQVNDGRLAMPASAAILRYDQPIEVELAYSEFIDYHFLPGDNG